MEDEQCRYCGGTCPNEPDDSEHLCDGFAGDIDGLYEDEEGEKPTSTFDTPKDALAAVVALSMQSLRDDTTEGGE